MLPKLETAEAFGSNEAYVASEISGDGSREVAIKETCSEVLQVCHAGRQEVHVFCCGDEPVACA